MFEHRLFKNQVGLSKSVCGGEGGGDASIWGGGGGRDSSSWGCQRWGRGEGRPVQICKTMIILFHFSHPIQSNPHNPFFNIIFVFIYVFGENIEECK